MKIVALAVAALFLAPAAQAKKTARKKAVDPYEHSRYRSKSEEHPTYLFSGQSSRSYRVASDDEAEAAPRKGRRRRHDDESKYLTPAEDLPAAYRFGEDGKPLKAPKPARAKKEKGSAGATLGAPPPKSRKLEPVGFREPPKNEEPPSEGTPKSGEAPPTSSEQPAHDAQAAGQQAE